MSVMVLIIVYIRYVYWTNESSEQEWCMMAGVTEIRHQSGIIMVRVRPYDIFSDTGVFSPS